MDYGYDVPGVRGLPGTCNVSSTRAGYFRVSVRVVGNRRNNNVSALFSDVSPIQDCSDAACPR